jgi:hypothetical protein
LCNAFEGDHGVIIVDQMVAARSMAGFTAPVRKWAMWICRLAMFLSLHLFGMIQVALRADLGSHIGAGLFQHDVYFIDTFCMGKRCAKESKAGEQDWYSANSSHSLAPKNIVLIINNILQ